jgi:DNA-binding Xre family transcriptional regulator
MKLAVRAIKILMAQQGIDTQRELAAAVGISENALSDLLKGKRTPGMDTVGALCKALKCTPNDILVLDDSPNRLAPVAEFQPS